MDVSRVTQTLTGKIRLTAYLFYLERTRPGLSGVPEKDWFEAEQRVMPFKGYVELQAYFIYLDRLRNEKFGDALSDWLEAETIEIARNHIGRNMRLIA